MSNDWEKDRRRQRLRHKKRDKHPNNNDLKQPKDKNLDNYDNWEDMEEDYIVERESIRNHAKADEEEHAET